MNPAKNRKGGVVRSELLLNFFGQGLEEFPDPSGVGPYVAFSHPGDGADVQAAPAIGRYDPYNNVVLEAEPEGRIRGFDPPLVRIGIDDHPAQRPGLF